MATTCDYTDVRSALTAEARKRFDRAEDKEAELLQLIAEAEDRYTKAIDKLTPAERTAPRLTAQEAKQTGDSAKLLKSLRSEQDRRVQAGETVDGETEAIRSESFGLAEKIDAEIALLEEQAADESLPEEERAKSARKAEKRRGTRKRLDEADRVIAHSKSSKAVQQALTTRKNIRERADKEFENLFADTAKHQNKLTTEYTEPSLFKDLVQNLINNVPKDPGHSKAKDDLLNKLFKLGDDNKDNIDNINTEILKTTLAYYGKYGTNASEIFLQHAFDADTFLESAKKSGKITHDPSIALSSLQDAMGMRSQAAPNLLAALPNAIDYLADPAVAMLLLPPEVVDDIKTQAGMTKFLAFHDDFVDAIDSVIPEFDDPKASDKALTREKGEFLASDLAESPFHYLRDPETGLLKQNVTTAMATAFYNWLGTRGGSTTWHDDDAAARIVGEIDPRHVPDWVLDKVREYGTLRKNLINDLQGMIGKQLNLSVSGKEDTDVAMDGLLQDKLYSSLALIAIEAGYKTNYLEKQFNVPGRDWVAMERAINSSDFNMSEARIYEILDKEDAEYLEDTGQQKNYGAQVPFIKIRTEKGVKEIEGKKFSIIQPTKKVQWAIDGNTDAQDFFEHVFDLKPGKKPPSDKPVKNSTKIKKGRMQVSGKLQQSANALSATPYIVSMPFQNLWSKFAPDVLQTRFMGMKAEEDVHVLDRDSQAGRNLGLQRIFDSLQEVFSRALGSDNKPLYYNVSTTRTNRQMLDNEGGHYQNSKWHRFSMAPKTWKKVIKQDEIPTDKQRKIYSEDVDEFIKGFNAVDAFKLAVAQAIGLDVDKQTLQKTLREVDDEIFLGKPGKRNEAIYQAVEAIRNNRDAEKITDPETIDTIIAGFEAGGEGPHTFAALQALAAYKDVRDRRRTKDTEFEHYLPIEIDGITNGLALSALQMPFGMIINPADPVGSQQRKEKYLSILARVGVYTDESDEAIRSYGFAKESNVVTDDNYQQLARNAEDEKAEMRLDATIENAANEYKASLPEQKSAARTKLNNAIEARFALRVLHPLMPVLIENNKITSAGRNLFKDPVMQNIYGASRKAINKLFSTVITKGAQGKGGFYSELMRLAERQPQENTLEAKKAQDAQNAKDMLVHIHNAFFASLPITDSSVATKLSKIEDLTGMSKQELLKEGLLKWKNRIPEGAEDLRKLTTKQILDAGPISFAKEFQLSKEVTARIEYRSALVYGGSAWAALEKEFGPFFATRDKLFQALTLNNLAFVALYEQRVEERIEKKNGAGLLPSEENQIIQDIIAEGLYSSFKHPSSTSRTDELEVTSTSLQPMGGEGSKRNIKGAKAVLRVKGKSSNNTDLTSYTVQRYQPDEDVGVKGYVRGIQNLDAHNMGDVIIDEAALEEYIMHAYDATFQRAEGAIKNGTIANRAIYNNSKNYSLSSAIGDAFTRMDALLDPNNNKLSKARKDQVMIEAIRKTEFGKLDIPLNEAYDLWKKDLLDTITHNEVERQILFKKIRNVGNFGLDQASYVVPNTEKPASTPPNTDEIFFANPGGFENPEYVSEEYTNTGLYKDNIIKLFNDLEQHEREGAKPSHEHKAQLLKVIQDLVIPGMEFTEALEQTLSIAKDSRLTNGRIEGNAIYLEAAGGKITSPIDMSLQETAVHEYVHAVLNHFFRDDPKARRTAERIFERAKELGITYEDFLPRDENDNITDRSTAAVERAQQRADYILYNEQGHVLEEFFAIGLTNPQFAAALRRKEMQRGETESRKIFEGGILSSMWNMINAAVDWFRGKTSDLDKGSVHDAMYELARDLVTVTGQTQEGLYSRAEHTYAEAASKSNAWIKEKIWDKALNKLETKFNEMRHEAYQTENGPHEFDEWFKHTKEAFNQTFNGMEVENRLGKELIQFASDLTRELKGLNPRDKEFWQKLHIRVKALVDQPRARLSKTVQKMVMQMFPEATDEQWAALNEALLRTDASSLIELGFSGRDLLNFLSDDISLDVAIARIKNEIYKGYGKVGTAFVNQAMGLASLMVRSQVPQDIDNQMTNAYSISKQFYHTYKNQRKEISNREGAEQLIDQLASLEALRISDPEQKRVAHELLSSSPEKSLADFLALHSSFKAVSHSSIFGSSKVHLWKGWTPEAVDPDRGIAVASLEDKEEMERAGYTYAGPMAIDPKSPDRTIRHLYKQRIGLDRLRAQVVSWTDLNHKGTDLNTPLREEHLAEYWKQGGAYVRQMKIKTEKGVGHLYNNKLDTSTIGHPKLIPILYDGPDSTREGEIVEYRYVMSDKQKRDWLKRQDYAHETLGNMFGSIPNKIGTKQINREVVDQLMKDYKEFNKNSDYKFINVGSNSTDPEIIEVWKRLPTDMKQYWKEKYPNSAFIPIRKDLFEYILGFREKTIPSGLIKFQKSKLGKKTGKLPEHYIRGIYMADKFWREALIPAARAKLSVLLPDVVIGNSISNYLLLVADAIPPSYAVKQSIDGIKEVRRYQRLQIKQNEVRLARDIARKQGKPDKKLEGELAYITHQLENSVVKDMYQAGLFQTIVEDIDPSAYAPKRTDWLGQKMAKGEKKLSALGLDPYIRWGKEVMMFPGTELFSAALTANQLADFGARYAKYKYDTEVRKIPSEVAKQDALDYFIYYDEPTNKWLQAGNEYGVWMFGKFFLRSQRVALKLLRERAASLAGAEMLNSMTIKEDTPIHYFLNWDKLTSDYRMDFFPILSRPGQAVGIPALDWFEYPFGLFR